MCRGHSEVGRFWGGGDLVQGKGDQCARGSRIQQGPAVLLLGHQLIFEQQLRISFQPEDLEGDGEEKKGSN